MSKIEGSYSGTVLCLTGAILSMLDCSDLYQAIYRDDALSQANLAPVSGTVLEKYGPEFAPQTGQGGFEIWIPIE